MKKILSCAIVLLAGFSIVCAQSTQMKNGTLYMAFGSHRIFYTNSDIHLHRDGGPSFDFTLFNAKAKDEGGLKFHTAPQFSYNIGYYFNKKNFGLEYQYDHIKYFLQMGQVVHLRGSIEGHHFDQDTLLTPEFVQLEHSDGGNYGMVNVVKWIPLASDRKQKVKLDAIVKAGLGLVNPKTNTTIMGNHRDDKYHISGFVTGIETGVRFNFLKYVFVTGTFKGAYANYIDILIAGGRGHQQWFSGQLIYMLGAQFPL
jgi:hypothetical protein